MSEKRFSRDEVKAMISSVMNKVDGTQSVPISHIQDELSSLAKTIDDLHADIIASQGHDVSDKHIPSATDELDAVVGATEDASAQIMDATEAIQGCAGKVADENVKNEILAHSTKIFEACSFQDITGQRISKVIKTLHDIEMAVDKLLNLFDPVAQSERLVAEDNRNEDDKLKNGPQLAGEGVTQDDIDKLLAEFD